MRSSRIRYIPLFIVICLVAVVLFFPTGLVGATVFSSLFNIFIFLGTFFLSIYASAFAVRHNEWVYEVKHMKYSFNPIFMTWLFATNRTRWAKWSTLECYIGTLLIGPLLFLAATSRKIIAGISVVGVLISLVILGVFAYFFYLSYLTLLKPQKNSQIT